MLSPNWHFNDVIQSVLLLEIFSLKNSVESRYAIDHVYKISYKVYDKLFLKYAMGVVDSCNLC